MGAHNPEVYATKLVKPPHQFQFYHWISATSFWEKIITYFVKFYRKKCKNILMDTVEEDVGPHGSRMGHPEGARTVVLSSNGMIYLIVLSFGFLQSCVNTMPALWGPPACDRAHLTNENRQQKLSRREQSNGRSPDAKKICVKKLSGHPVIVNSHKQQAVQ